MKIGDRVSVVNENLKGKIIKIENEIIFFQDTEDFVYQYHREELVVSEDIFDEIEFSEKMVAQKQNFVSEFKKNKKSEILVLDLHFDKIFKDKKVKNGTERLFLQREKLLETLEFCKKNKIKNLEIIHGIGSGVLQNMVIETLNDQTQIEFYHQSILKDESGAIMVEFF